MSGSSRGQKMLLNTVIIILNGTVTVNVFAIFTRNYCWSYISHTGKDEDLDRFHNSVNVYRASSTSWDCRGYGRRILITLDINWDHFEIL